MGQTIRLSAPVYDRLERFRDKRETFSGAVNRLLTIRDGIASLTQTIEGVTEFAKYQKERLTTASEKDTSGDSSKVSDVPTREVGTWRPPVPEKDV